jgi:predicted ATPase
VSIADPPVRSAFQERPLVGRSREVQAITAALDRLDAGAGGCIQVIGDPGTGKSRLLAELRRQAVKRGMEVCTARAGESGSTIPFQVFVEALDDQVRRLPPDGLPGPALELVRRVFAPVTGGPTGWPPAEAPRAERFQVFQALRQLLCAVGAGQRLVLVLDDVHWGDPESIDFFDYLCRHPVPVPLLVALAARARQAPARLRSALIRSAEQFAVTRLELGALSRAEAADLVGLDPDAGALGRL